MGVMSSTSPSTTPAFALSGRAVRTGPQPISYLLKQAVDNPELISLAAGLVDYESLPVEPARRAMTAALDEQRGRRTLQYGTTAGDAALRQRLLEHMAALDGLEPADLHATADDVVIATGSQQLLFLLTEVLVDPGDIVITAAPSYFVYTGTLATFGARVHCVDMDECGMVPASLERVLARLQSRGELERVKIIYICDYHQNPTGLTLAADRRGRIVRVVQRYSQHHQMLLIEDAAYRELTYEGRPPPSLKRHDEGNRFIALLQTFSKPFAPGLKTGYGLLPRALVEPVVLQKGNHDFGSANLCQQLILEAMTSGDYDRHVAALCRRYAQKRDAMLEALNRELGGFQPEATHWTRPAGGLYIYLTLPPEIDTGPEGDLFRRAIREGVLYVPGVYCFAPDLDREVPCNTMRLSFGVCSIEQIHEGVARLARAIRAVATGA